MSIIFRSLQKLDSHGSDAVPRQLPETVTQGDLRALSAGRSNSRIMLRICFAFMGIVVLGLGVVFIAEYLTGREHLPADASADASHSLGKIPKTAVTQTASFQGPTSQPDPKIKEVSHLQARFYPAQHQQSAPLASSTLASVDMEIPGMATDSGTATSPSSTVPGVGANESNPGKTTHNPIDTFDASSPSRTKKTIFREAEKPVAQIRDMNALALPQEHSSLSTLASAKEHTRATEQRRVDNIRLKTLAKNAHIGRLARRTQAALAQDPMDIARAGSLIEELSREKGTDHPFVAKLRAYFLFKQARHEEATVILERLIAANADDIEAGMNLALIEIQTGQIPEATERLKHLGVEHPDNTAVADLLRKLQ